MKKPTNDSDPTLCSCFEFRKNDLISLIGSDPTLTFDRLLEQTKIGSKCTACLLDLEFMYAEVKADPNLSSGQTKAAANWIEKGKRSKSLKQGMYEFLDALAPDLALKSTSRMPIFLHRDLQTFIRMANHSLLYRGEVSAPDYKMTLNIRAPDGRLVSKKVVNVDQGSVARVNVSEPLYAELGEIDEPVCGSVEIIQVASESGLRGTRRPQMELSVPTGVGALHGQAVNRFERRAALVAPHKPKDERSFVTFVNESDQTRSLDLIFPLELPEGSPDRIHVNLTAPPKGASVYELSLPEEAARHLKHPLYTISWRADPFTKLHRVGTAADFGSYSIDHL